VLACSAVETVPHLLLNKTREFPNGLANSSGQVGRNLTSHFGLTVYGFFPELKNRDATNDDGTNFYHPSSATIPSQQTLIHFQIIRSCHKQHNQPFHKRVIRENSI